jgi:hypothetical protein
MSKRLSTSRFFPLLSYESGVEKAHGRIERRRIDVLPAEAAGIEDEWPTARQICRVTRWRQRKVNGKWQDPKVEVVYLITSLKAQDAAPEALLKFNRGHWGIEIMHSRQGRDARRGRLHQPQRQRAPQHLHDPMLRAQNPEIRLALAYASH